MIILGTKILFLFWGAVQPTPPYHIPSTPTASRPWNPKYASELLQVPEPPDSRERFSTYFGRGQVSRQREAEQQQQKWGPENPQTKNNSVFWQNRIPNQKPRAQVTAQSSAAVESSTPSKKLDFHISWSSDSDNNSSRVRQTAPPTYQFNLSDSD